MAVAELTVRFSVPLPHTADRKAYGDGVVDLAQHISHTSPMSYPDALRTVDSTRNSLCTLDPDISEADHIAAIRRNYEWLGHWGLSLLSMSLSVQVAGRNIMQACNAVSDAVSRIPPDEPLSRSERRQMASPRYQRAASHGADGQREMAHKAWRGE